MRTYIPDNYGISRARYRELLNFCLQYNDWRRQAGDIYRKNIEMVEDCARQADPAIAEYLIKSVTQGGSLLCVLIIVLLNYWCKIFFFGVFPGVNSSL